MVSEADKIESINPATEELLATFQPSSAHEVEAVCARAADAFRSWRTVSFGERAERMRSVAAYLRCHPDLARLITAEMGKPIAEAEAEIEKCAWVCDYYAEHAPAFLAARSYPSAATESYVSFTPLGAVLAIMPWNFPFWQLMRFAAPALMAGNVGILKHASNVPQCALAAEEMFRASGFPAGVFQTLLLSAAETQELLDDPRIAAVTLTGSERAGSQVAEAAGRRIKKSVLELGGSDAFIVLEDADLRRRRRRSACARASRTPDRAASPPSASSSSTPSSNRFATRFVEEVRKLRVGDPAGQTDDHRPAGAGRPARHAGAQLQSSVADGAAVLVGGERRSRTRLLFRPDGGHRRRTGHVPGPRGSVRARRAPHARARRARGGRGSQRLELRPRLQPVDARPTARARPGERDRSRARLRQRHGRLRSAPALRRRQAIGIRPRAFGLRHSRVRQRPECMDRTAEGMKACSREPPTSASGAPRCRARGAEAHGRSDEAGVGRRLSGIHRPGGGKCLPGLDAPALASAK